MQDCVRCWEVGLESKISGPNEGRHQARPALASGLAICSRRLNLGLPCRFVGDRPVGKRWMASTWSLCLGPPFAGIGACLIGRKLGCRTVDESYGPRESVRSSGGLFARGYWNSGRWGAWRLQSSFNLGLLQHRCRLCRGFRGGWLVVTTPSLRLAQEANCAGDWAAGGVGGLSRGPGSLREFRIAPYVAGAWACTPCLGRTGVLFGLLRR